MLLERVAPFLQLPTLNIATALIFFLMQAKSSALVYHTTMTLHLTESLSTLQIQGQCGATHLNTSPLHRQKIKALQVLPTLYWQAQND